MLVIGGRPNETEHDGKEEKTVKEAKDDDQEEDLEEGGEDVGLGAGKEDEGQEGGEAAVEDCGADGVEGVPGALPPVPAPGHDVGHPDVGGVVQGEAHGENQQDGGGDLK